MREKPRPAKGILYLTRIYAPRGGLSRLHPRKGSFHWRNGERSAEKAFDQGREEEQREREREVGEENSSSLREFEEEKGVKEKKVEERGKNVEESKGRERKMGRNVAKERGYDREMRNEN